MKTRFETLKIKAAGEPDGLNEGQFTAYASVFNEVDSYNEVTKPGCFAKSIAEHERTDSPIPVLYGHDQTDPSNIIGQVVQAVEDEHGLLVTCQLDVGADIDNDTARQVWGLVKGRRLKSMSIGFIPVTSTIENTPDGPVRALTEVDLKEVSVVLVPANEAAEILAVKAAEDSEIVLPYEEVALAYLNFKPTISKSTYLEYVELTKDQRKVIGMPKVVMKKYEEEQELKEFLRKAAQSGRGLTAEEAARIPGMFRSIEETQKQIERFELMERQGDILRKALGGGTYTQEEALGSKMHRSVEGIVLPPEQGNLAVRSGEIRDRAQVFASDLTYYAAGMEQKSFTATGSVTSTLMIDNEVERQPRPATNILEVIPFKKVEQPTFSYIRQNKRVNNAAIVPAGQRKPVSEYGVERVDDELAVIAHIVKGIDKYILQDNSALADFIAAEMIAGVYEKLEGFLVDELKKTEGIQQQEFQEDRFTSIRSAITKLQSSSLEPGAIVLNPLDWQAIEVAKADTAGNFIFGSAPVNQVERTLWSTPVVVSHRAKQGEGFVLDVNAAEIAGDGQMELAWDSSGDAFEMNTFSLRVESRFKPFVRRAAGVVEVKLSQ